MRWGGLQGKAAWDEEKVKETVMLDRSAGNLNFSARKARKGESRRTQGRTVPKTGGWICLTKRGTAAPGSQHHHAAKAPRRQGAKSLGLAFSANRRREDVQPTQKTR